MAANFDRISSSNKGPEKEEFELYAPIHSPKNSPPPRSGGKVTLGAQLKEEGMLLKESTEEALKSIAREGLQHPRAVAFLLLWYLFSAGTIFLNKYILSYQNLDPYLLCKYKWNLGEMVPFWRVILELN